MKVMCMTCGKQLELESPDDQSVLLIHAVKHRKDSEMFIADFNETPITFPIQFENVLGE